MRSLVPPIFQQLESSQRVLIAGMGGGFDVYSGLPLYFALREAGKQVFLANLSFAFLNYAKELCWELFEVKSGAQGMMHYFPEGYLCDWFQERGEDVRVYAFNRTGVKTLRAGYEYLIDHLKLDTIVLVDGGTDSLMRGDEAGLGTPEEDASSLAAVSQLEGVAKYMICLGFGVDAFHGVCHVQVLEAIADLTTTGDYLGAWSLTPEMPEVQLYLEATNYASERMPTHPSIVSNSILDAIGGRFGNVHRTERTRGTDLFINPLMGLYWAFTVDGVAKRNLYLRRLMNTNNFSALRRIVHEFDETRTRKPWQTFPH
jgi:hypothetical protein